VVLVLAAVAVVAATAVAAANDARVSVSPAQGRPKSKFTVSFRAPDSAGLEGSLRTLYSVQASGRAGANRCTSRAGAGVASARARSRVRVTLQASRGWCKGTFHGRIDETQSPICTAHLACPLFVRIVRRIGTFTFRVR